MAHRVCPWWVGYLLASPLRRLMQDPTEILRPFVSEGMTVLEPGPGMGFFTLELARLAGPRGRVIAVDIQPRMLEGLAKRADRAGLRDRIDVREAAPDRMGTEDLEGKVDLVLAFAVIHELGSAERFFAEAYRALKRGGRLLAAEPKRHVRAAEFDETLSKAEKAGFAVVARPGIRGSRTALLEK